MAATCPLRVLFVLTSPVRGGVEEVALSLVRRLPRPDFRPALAAPPSLLAAMSEDLRGSDVETFAVAADSWLRPREVKALASCIRAFQPDVVNPHLFRSTLVAAPLAKQLGVRAVVETYHGREAWRRGPLRGSFAVDRLVSRWVDRVIAVSEAARDFLVAVKRIPAHKVLVIPNGRDLSVFTPGDARAAREALSLPATAPLIGLVGRLEPQKGHAFALEALQRVVAELPEARLLVVGEGRLRGALEQAARQKELAGQVVFTGYRADVARWLQAIDVLLLPSLYEGMPLTAIEASAMGRPVVATRIDGTAEVVEDGVTGLLVPPADPAALSDALLRVLRDPAFARRLGDAGRRRMLERFDFARQLGATAEVYRDAAVSARPAAGKIELRRPA